VESSVGELPGGRGRRGPYLQPQAALADWMIQMQRPSTTDARRELWLPLLSEARELWWPASRRQRVSRQRRPASRDEAGCGGTGRGGLSENELGEK
jgi:hypothetical protein